MSVKEKISDYIGKWIIVILGVVSALGTFTSVFEIKVSMLLVWIVTMAASGILLAISKFKPRYKRTIILILGVIMVIIIIILRKALINGIYSVANDVIRVYNAYVSGENVAYFNVTPQGRFFDTITRYNTLLFCMIALYYSFLLVSSTSYKLFASIHILLSMIFVIPGLILGKMPNSAYVTLIIIYYLICFMYQHNRTVYLGRMAGLALLSVSVVGLIFLFNRPSEYNAKERYRKYSESLNKIAEKFRFEDWSLKGLKSLFEEQKTANGGINGGKLGEIVEIKYTGDVMLKLKMQPDENNLYLKGFVANEYMGNSWKEISDSHYALYNRFLSENPGIDLFEYNMELFDEKKSLTIEYEKDSKNYRFFPYFCDISTLNMVPRLYDLRFKVTGEQRYSYSYASLSEDEFFSYYGYDESRETVEELYYNISLYVPENISDLFDEILVNPVYYDFTPEGLKACAEYVRTFLKENTTYSLKPGKLEPGEDYVVDFLTNKKKGYCTAYASAAVLMFRYLGVPARYVEGYVVASQDIGKIKPDDEGYINVSVKDYSAHAWPEIYVSGFGFVPVEVTPGYSQTQSGGDGDETIVSSGKETDTNGQTSENQTTRQPQTTTAADNPGTTGRTAVLENKNELNNNGKNAYFICGIIVFVIIACAVSVVLYKNLNKKKQVMDYKTQDFRHNIIVLSGIFNKCLDKLNIRHSNDVQLGVISEEVNRRIAGCREAMEEKGKAGSVEQIKLSLEDTLSVLEIIAKAKYSDKNAEITEKEYDKVRQYVEEFKNSLQYLKNKV